MNCKSCSRTNEHGNIKFDTYISLLNRHDPNLFDWLKLQGLGEPMMYPQIEQLVEVAHDRGYRKVMTITNGTLPIIGNFNKVIVSLNSVRDPKFSKVMYNINDALDRGYNLSINCVLTNESTRDDIKNMQNLTDNLGIHLDLTPMEVWYGTDHQCYKESRDNAMKAYDLFNIHETHRIDSCEWGVTSLYHDYLGRLHPCCIRMTDEYIIDSVDNYNYETCCKECPL
jgi:molybdenum cofactor biosynthesis enzyme MoaA